MCAEYVYSLAVVEYFHFKWDFHFFSCPFASEKLCLSFEHLLFQYLEENGLKV